MPLLSKSSAARVLSVVGLLSLLLCSCNGKNEGTPTAKVSGTATVKDKAISQGGLGMVFETDDGGTKTVNINQDGSFSGQAPIGSNKVYLELVPQEGSPISDHGDTKGIAETYGIDPGFLVPLDAETPEPKRFHEVEVPEEGKTDLTLDFGPGAGTKATGGPGGGH